MHYPDRSVNIAASAAQAECCNSKTSPNAWIPLFTKSASFPVNDLPPGQVGIAACNDGAVGDLNGDGVADMVLTAYVDIGGQTPSTSEAWVYLSQNGTTVGPTKYIAQTGEDYPGYVTLGDLNADGVLDMAVSTASTIDIYINQGNGAFGGETEIPGCSGARLRIADLNGDGWGDLVESCGAAFEVFINGRTTPPTFAAPQSLPVSGGDFVLGDFNGDSRIDLAYAAGGGLAWVANSDADVFGPPHLLMTTGVAGGLALYPGPAGTGFVASLSDSNMAACLPAGDFPNNPLTYRSDLGGGTIASADIDGDGITDVVVGNNQAVDVYIGLGKGFASEVTNQVPGSDFIQRIGLGDVNGDGAVDLVVFWGNGPLELWTNSCP